MLGGQEGSGKRMAAGFLAAILALRGLGGVDIGGLSFLFRAKSPRIRRRAVPSLELPLPNVFHHVRISAAAVDGYGLFTDRARLTSLHIPRLSSGGFPRPIPIAFDVDAERLQRVPNHHVRTIPGPCERFT